MGVPSEQYFGRNVTMKLDVLMGVMLRKSTTAYSECHTLEGDLRAGAPRLCSAWMWSPTQTELPPKPIARTHLQDGKSGLRLLPHLPAGEKSPSRRVLVFWLAS